MKTRRRIEFAMSAIAAIAVVSMVGAIVRSAEIPNADEVIAMLTRGNERFAAGKPAYPHEDAMRRAAVVAGQHPIATVIACSDSRVPPEILFDEGIGDLFVVRVIGNIGGADQTGSAEYGVEHLGTPLLVVLGHTGCGAVTAAVTHAEVRGSIPPLLAHIQPAVRTARRNHPELKGKDLIPEAIRANVFHSIEELFARSEAIRARVRAGKLTVVGAIYDLQSGRVNWLGAQSPKFPRQNKKASMSRHH
jgi:carbonic anhydrase